MPPKPAYVIVFVSDMDRAVKFYRLAALKRIRDGRYHGGAASGVGAEPGPEGPPGVQRPGVGDVLAGNDG